MGSEEGAWKAAAPGEGQIYEGHGVWVPPGMTARDIMVGAAVLERDFEISHYTARSIVRAILRAIGPTRSEAEKESASSP
jgi:hypothetical protein